MGVPGDFAAIDKDGQSFIPGQPPGDLSALVNPEAVAEIQQKRA